MDNNDISRITAIRAAYVGMTATLGWNYFKQMAENRVQQAKDDILEGKTPEEREEKAIYARAMRDAVRDLLNAVDVTKAFSPEAATDDSGLGNLELEEANAVKR